MHKQIYNGISRSIELPASTCDVSSLNECLDCCFFFWQLLYMWLLQTALLSYFTTLFRTSVTRTVYAYWVPGTRETHWAKKHWKREMKEAGRQRRLAAFVHHSVRPFWSRFIRLAFLSCRIPCSWSPWHVAEVANLQGQRQNFNFCVPMIFLLYTTVYAFLDQAQF